MLSGRLLVAEVWRPQNSTYTAKSAHYLQLIDGIAWVPHPLRGPDCARDFSVLEKGVWRSSQLCVQYPIRITHNKPESTRSWYEPTCLNGNTMKNVLPWQRARCTGPMWVQEKCSGEKKYLSALQYSGTLTQKPKIWQDMWLDRRNLLHIFTIASATPVHSPH